jgi:hypothetical protein
MAWSELHDATLESIELAWDSGEVLVRIRTGDARRPRCAIVASAARGLTCERQMSWGSSVSIHGVRGPSQVGDGVSALEVEMQSGDVIRIEAGTFSLRDDP